MLGGSSQKKPKKINILGCMFFKITVLENMMRKFQCYNPLLKWINWMKLQYYEGSNFCCLSFCGEAPWTAWWSWMLFTCIQDQQGYSSVWWLPLIFAACCCHSTFISVLPIQWYRKAFKCSSQKVFVAFRLIICIFTPTEFNVTYSQNNHAQNCRLELRKPLNIKSDHWSS